MSTKPSPEWGDGLVSTKPSPDTKPSPEWGGGFVSTKKAPEWGDGVVSTKLSPGFRVHQIVPPDMGGG